MRTIKLGVCFLILTFVVPNFSASQQIDIKKRLAQCAAIKGDLERLECYDRLARKLELIVNTKVLPIMEAGKWSVNVQKNPIDDTKTVTLYLTADEGKSHMGQMINLVIRCKSNTTELIISWWDYLGLDETSVITRVGNANAEQKMWPLSTNNTGTFYPGSPIAFIKTLMSADKLVAQVTPYNESPVTAIFDIRGIAEAIKPLQETCGWK